MNFRCSVVVNERPFTSLILYKIFTGQIIRGLTEETDDDFLVVDSFLRFLLM